MNKAKMLLKKIHESKFSSSDEYPYPKEGEITLVYPSSLKQYNRYSVGDKHVVHIGAPGYGAIVYEFVKKDDKGLWGKVLSYTGPRSFEDMDY